MCISAIELIRNRLVPIFKEDFENIAMEDGICEVFKTPVHGYVHIASDKTKSIQSDVLRVFTQPSYKNIGVFKGTVEEPTSAMRFIDYAGALLIIPTDSNSPVEFWCGGKYIDKFSKESPIQLKPLAGNAALLALIEDHRPMLVIEVSPRKELYLKNLIVGDKNNLVLCNEIGATITPRKNWSQFKEAFLQLDKKNRKEAIIVLRGVTNGWFDQTNQRVQTFYENNMSFAQICSSTLPANPVARTVWLSAISSET